MPDRIGKGFNPHYNGSIQQQKINQLVCQEENDEIVVPKNVEKEFIKPNQVYYIVLKQGQEKSTKQIVKCQGCDRAITLEDKKFPNNMVFHFKTYCLVPAAGGQGTYVQGPKLPCKLSAYTLLRLRASKDPNCVKPIVTDTGGNQSSTQVHQYLRTNLG